MHEMIVNTDTMPVFLILSHSYVSLYTSLVDAVTTFSELVIGGCAVLRIDIYMETVVFYPKLRPSLLIGLLAVSPVPLHAPPVSHLGTSHEMGAQW